MINTKKAPYKDLEFLAREKKNIYIFTHNL